jgi:hypothetical protein
LEKASAGRERNDQAPGIGETANPFKFSQKLGQIQQGTLLQVELTRRTDWKHLARNSVVEGRLMLPVF